MITKTTKQREDEKMTQEAIAFDRIPEGKPVNDHYRILYTPKAEVTFEEKLYMALVPEMKKEYDRIHA